MYHGQIFTPSDLNLPFPIDKPQVSPHVRMHPQNPSGHTTRVFQSLVGTLAAYLKPSFRTKLFRMDGCPSWSCHDPLRCKTSGTSCHVRAMSCKRDTPSCPWREWSPWWTRTRTFFLKWSLIIWIKGRLRCRQFNIGIGCWQKICPACPMISSWVTLTEHYILPVLSRSQRTLWTVARQAPHQSLLYLWCSSWHRRRDVSAPQLGTWLQTLLVLKTFEWGLKIVELHLMTFTSLDISDQEILQLCQLPILRSHCATALSNGRRSLQQMIDIWADVLPKEQLKRYLEMGRRDTRGSNRKLPQMERPWWFLPTWFRRWWRCCSATRIHCDVFSWT